ncbi:hypothetical protein [Pseudomonas sp. NPDC089569]|uniref:hypothetical protein n=1 Tax=Pseudomonas sp. NPDC089569 TaxID=3390722 RepID=UPI003CFEA85C
MLTLLQATPLWVYAVFLLLCYLGIKALFPTRESKITLLITPVFLLCWSLYSLDLTSNALLSLGYWSVAVVVASVAALVIFSRKGIQLDESASGLLLPGTTTTLALYLLFFTVSAYFGYQAQVHPHQSARLTMVLLKAVTSGLVAGLFCGRSIRFYQVFLALRAVPVTRITSTRPLGRDNAAPVQ